MTQQNIVKTPGYNCRLGIFFQYDKNGKKVAYEWTWKSYRAIRVNLKDAEMWIAQDLADLLPGHPLKG